MRKVLWYIEQWTPVVAIVLAILATIAVSWAHLLAADPPVKMAWTMDPAFFPLRAATLTAYPVAASDFEVPVRCAYLGDLDTYVWQFKAHVPEALKTGDWILYGQGPGGLTVCQHIWLAPGTTGALAPVTWEQGEVWNVGDGATTTFPKPAIEESLVARWEILVDGKPVAPDAGGLMPPMAGARTVQLRAVLAGSPLHHELLGPMLRLEFAEGRDTQKDRT
ncbi:MAG: hypothetical protein AB1824_01805 [Acidobacteriota bacterium]